MAEPESIIGVGLTIFGIGIPGSIALLRLFPKKNGNGKLPDNIVDDGKCSERREMDRKLIESDANTITQKFITVHNRLDHQDAALDRLETITTRIFDKIDKL